MDRRDFITRGFGLMSLAMLGTLASAPARALDRPLTLEEQGLLRAISIHNSQIRTMAGRFVQIDSGGGRTEGIFHLVRPNKVHFRYAPPSREEIVSTGNGFYVLNREEETKYAYPQDKVPLRQFLGDKIDLLNVNIGDVVMTDQLISVSLVDESPMGTVEVALIFESDTLELWQWTLIEPSGGELTFSLFDVIKDIEIPNGYFSIPAHYKAPSNQ